MNRLVGNSLDSNLSARCVCRPRRAVSALTWSRATDGPACCHLEIACTSACSNGLPSVSCGDAFAVERLVGEASLPVSNDAPRIDGSSPTRQQRERERFMPLPLSLLRRSSLREPISHTALARSARAHHL